MSATDDLVFISYSHTDAAWRDRLLVFLKPFVRQGQFQVWADSRIQAGSLWRREIDNALTRARVGVILLSAELLASDFISEVELPALLKRATVGELSLLVVPIEAHVAGSTRLSGCDLTEFQWPWPPDYPLDGLSQDRRNRALVTVSEAIIRAAGVKEVISRAVPSERTSTALAQGGRNAGMLYGVPPLPPNYVDRPETLEAIKRALFGTSAVVGVSASTPSIGVHGAGGLGKTVTAQALMHDLQVRRTFVDGLFWITVGQDPRLEALQAALLDFLGHRVAIQDVTDGIGLLRTHVRGKACLLVLDDVWQLADAHAFDVLDAQGRLLITTRNRSILPQLGAREIPLESMSTQLSVELLARWAGVPASQLPAAASQIAESVQGLPLALSLAGAQVRHRRSWEDVLGAIRSGETAYLDHPYANVFKSLQASLAAITPEDAARYVELAVFPEDTAIPVSIVDELWHATAGYGSEESGALIERLASRNLLLITPPTSSSARAVSLHDLQNDFVRLLVPSVTHLHEELLNSWRSLVSASVSTDQSLGSWARLPAEPKYRWQYLTHHLRQALLDNELGALLTSVDWLYARVRQFSTRALLSDYRAVMKDRGLRQVRNAIARSAVVVSRDPTALSGQLAGQLLESDDQRVQSLLRSTPTELSQQSLLIPISSCLVPVKELRTDSYKRRVLAAALSVRVMPGGARAISGSRDGTLTIWDLVSGQQLKTFGGEERGLHALSVSSTGDLAVSGTDTGKLIVWDVQAGACLSTVAAHDGLLRSVSIMHPNRALSLGRDQNVRLWNLSGGALSPLHGHRVGGVTAIAPLDGTMVISGTDDGVLSVWDIAAGVPIDHFQAHEQRVTAIAVCAERQVFSASRDGTVKLWNLRHKSLVRTFRGHVGPVEAVDVLPGNALAVSGGRDRTLKLWDVETATVVSTFYGEDPVIALSVGEHRRVAFVNLYGSISMLRVTEMEAH